MTLTVQLSFGRQFVKRFALCYGTAVCLSVCNVGVLWPNGWTDLDTTWYGGRPRPSHSVLDRDQLPSQGKGHTPAPTFRSMSIVAKRSPMSVTAELLFPITEVARNPHFGLLSLLSLLSLP